MSLTKPPTTCAWCLESPHLCTGRICPVFLMKGRSGRYANMFIPDLEAREIRVLSRSSRGFKNLRLYRSANAYADFVCGTGDLYSITP